MLESPVPLGAPPDQPSNSLPPPTSSIKEVLKLKLPAPSFITSPPARCGHPSRGDGEPSFPAVDPGTRAPPRRPIDDPGLGRRPIDSRPPAPPRRPIDSRPPAPPRRPIDNPGFPLQARDSCRPARRTRPSAHVDDPGSARSGAIHSRPSAPRPRPSIRVDDPGFARVPLQAIDSRPPARRPRPSSTHVDDPNSGRSGAIESRPSAPRPRPSIRVDDPGLGRLQAIDSCRLASRPRPQTRVDDPNSGRSRAIDLRPSAPRPRPLIRADDPGSGRIRAVNSRPTAPRPRPLSRVDGPCKPSAANKELEEADKEIQRLNELGLGDDINYEEYCAYVKQLPVENDVDTSAKLDAVQLKELSACHALYRIKYYQYQLSQKVPKDNLCYDKLEVDHPSSCLEKERFFNCDEEDGELDWFFHPDYCKVAGLEDYQRLVPQNYGGGNKRWDQYHKNLYSYEIEQEYISYCEEMSKKLKWMEAYVPNKSPSLKWGRILTRGTFQAIKIATGFSNITGGLAFCGFNDWFDSMRLDVCFLNEFDGIYYEIWQRYTNEKKFKDALDEVYKLDRFPLRQETMRYALENDKFCSDLEEEFLACTICLKEFTEDKARVTEEKARELILEALRKKKRKPMFYEEYCRKKIDIARAIGLISS